MIDTKINSLTRAQVFALLLSMTYLGLLFACGGVLFLLAVAGLI